MSTRRTGAAVGARGARSSARARAGVRRWRWERAAARVWAMLCELGGGVGGAMGCKWLVGGCWIVVKF